MAAPIRALVRIWSFASFPETASERKNPPYQKENNSLITKKESEK
ncbi:hypothetical protein LEP1GSC088_4579 [Leptospira interrogans str. L1207]|nr:hypothetical protein LEP1GSC088_4579 [Leptospira interrogans str. L1207]